MVRRLSNPDFLCDYFQDSTGLITDPNELFSTERPRSNSSPPQLWSRIPTNEDATSGHQATNDEIRTQLI